MLFLDFVLSKKPHCSLSPSQCHSLLWLHFKRTFSHPSVNRLIITLGYTCIKFEKIPPQVIWGLLFSTWKTFDLERTFHRINRSAHTLSYISRTCYVNIESLLSKSLMNPFFPSRSAFTWLFTTMLLLHGACSTWVILFNILCRGSTAQLMSPPMTQVLTQLRG